MLIRDIDKEIMQLDYEIVIEQVKKEAEEVYSSCLSLMDEGVLFSDISIQDFIFDGIYLHSTGVYLLLKQFLEISDPLLWEFLKRANSVFMKVFPGISENDLSLYVFTVGQVSQKAYFGLYNPNSDFVTPISDLPATLQYEFSNRHQVFTEEELNTMASHVSDSILFLPEKLFSDSTGDYILVHRQWQRRSLKDPDKYYFLTLFGGILGFHKFYIKCYGSFFLYFITLGFFGVGWVFDLLEIVLGVAKDKKKFYIGPFENLGVKRITFFIVLVFYILFSFFFIKFL